MLPEGEQPADVAVTSGVVSAVSPHGALSAAQLIDVGDLVVMPGLVDAHVHVNQPGRTDWEGFHTATRAAAAGGITTLVDMPLNSIPPTCSLEALQAKQGEAAEEAWVDVAFWGGVVPGNLDRLEELVAAGVCGFKAFLIDSGVPEFPPVEPPQVAEVLSHLASWDVPLLVHAELEAPMAEAQRRFANADSRLRRRYASYLASRPAEGEDRAVGLVIRLAEQVGAWAHLLHLASGSAVEMVRAARSRGVRITAETCPHYLTVSAEDIPDGATAFKCAPPIRESHHREALWSGLADGSVGMVVSDHSPAPPEVKALESGDFGRAWGGISSLQLRLPLVWSEARRRGHTREELARWLCDAPAQLAGLGSRKGRIAVGCDADLVIWDPDGAFTVDPAGLQHRHPVSPYAGRVLSGEVRTTILRGEVVFEDPDRFQRRGRLLERGR